MVILMQLTFYWYPQCGTCQKAKKWLTAHGFDVKPIHIVENPPTAQELKQLYELSGMELKKFFNTSGKKYRELNMKEKIKQESEAALLEILASNGMLIKRPIVTDGSKVTIGFKEEAFEQAWL